MYYALRFYILGSTEEPGTQKFIVLIDSGATTGEIILYYVIIVNNCYSSTAL